MRSLLSLGVFLLLMALWSCTQEEEGTTVVATEEVIFLSGDKVRVLGRLITNQPISASDHGFQISTSENFSAPIIISLGGKEGPGRFIGETEGLKINQPYFLRAFATVGGTDLVGDAITIKTLNPIFETYSPTFANVGQEILITGRNFPVGTRVFFGTQEATVLQNSFESRLRVRIPEPKGEPIVKIRVQIQDTVFEFPQSFEYQSGKYTLLGQFPGGLRIYDNVFFQNQSGFHVGLGALRLGAGYYQGFQRYDPNTNTWAQVDFPGEGREGAFATSNFLGGGAVEVTRDVFEYKRDFWQIEGSTFSRLPDLPTISFNSLAFEVNGLLFLAGGTGIGAREVSAYNPSTQSWASRGSAPINLTNNLAWFVFQNKAYFVAADNRIWEFDPNKDEWKIFIPYPGSLGEGYGMAQVINNKVYVGLYRRVEQLWELDMTTRTWKAKNFIPGFPQSINSAHFTFNGQIYILRAPEEPIAGTLPMEFYRFDPNGI
ncbi:IPT/TIG domain-containing protein [Algoriphagus sp.]|uniref:IPT/TIG domain-containing protein n=1 Tax=Algoriphagus sp. TaxID=1872435 RepID=UPI00391924D8